MEDKNFKILLVEDNINDANAIIEILDNQSYDTTHVQESIVALEIINKQMFDLILLDIRLLGELDGFDVCKEIKEIPNHHDIPIIFITGSNDSESIKKGFDYGGVDYITKPYLPVELLARVKIHLELKTHRDNLKRSNKTLKEKVKGHIKQDLLFKEILEEKASKIENEFKDGKEISINDLEKLITSIITQIENKKDKKQKFSTPRIFIGSSTESKDVGEYIQANLDDFALCEPWHQGVFELSSYFLEDLLNEVEKVDYAIFVFNKDDGIFSREKFKWTVRDNVLFELGLFISNLGRKRVFFVTQDTNEKKIGFKLPSDLFGVVNGSYKEEYYNRSPRAALGKFCRDVKDVIQKDFRKN